MSDERPSDTALHDGGFGERNLKLTIEYDGTDFDGFQRIPGRRTVQGDLERALSRVMQEEVRIAAAGRTDAGVHALGQVVSFHTACAIPVDRVGIALNTELPTDIAVRSAEDVDAGFHARYSATARVYRYTVLNADSPCALLRRYTCWERRPLDERAMHTAAGFLVGVHDFASFRAPDPELEHSVREVYSAEVVRLGDLVSVGLKANAFLRSMARIIAGTLIQVGLGRLRPEDVAEILAAKDRRLAGRAAPASGLCLVHVDYDGESKNAHDSS